MLASESPRQISNSRFFQTMLRLSNSPSIILFVRQVFWFTIGHSFNNIPIWYLVYSKLVRPPREWLGVPLVVVSFSPQLTTADNEIVDLRIGESHSHTFRNRLSMNRNQLSYSVRKRYEILAKLDPIIILCSTCSSRCCNYGGSVEHNRK